MENVGEKIFNLRKEKGVSQEKLAEALGVARFTVSRWETNAAKPTAENVKSLCGFFGVTSAYFFDSNGENAVAEAETAIRQPSAETVKKESKFRNLKIVSVVVAIVLLAFAIIICAIAAYVAISPGSGGEWGQDIHIVNYAGIIYLAVGSVSVAVLATVSALLIFKYAKRKNKPKIEN